MDPDDLSELKHEFRTARPYRCSDGFCGYEDCQRCHPGASMDEAEMDEA